MGHRWASVRSVVMRSLMENRFDGTVGEDRAPNHCNNKFDERDFLVILFFVLPSCGRPRLNRIAGDDSLTDDTWRRR